MTEYDIRLTMKAATAETGIGSLAMRSRWVMHRIGNRKDDVFMSRWITPQDVEVRYIEDPLTGIPFLTLRGEHAAEVADLIRSSCDLWDFPEALAALGEARDRDERLTAAYAAAFTAPAQPVGELVESYRALAADPDPGLRQSVVVATGYVPWPPLVDLVRQLSETDPVEHVRENARLLLEGLRIHDEGS